MNTASLTATPRPLADFISKHFEKLGPILRAMVAIAIGVLLGAFHHAYVFPSYFHGDAASMQILASAIVDDKSLAPHDFVFANQLILWRSSPFIALALILGANGYNAFVLGSTISIAFWFLICYLALALYFSSTTRALYFTALLFVPISYWDNDFMLGQQSHLSHIGLSLAIVTLTYVCVAKPRLQYTLLLIASLGAMSAESPARTAMVLVPLLAALGCAYRTKRVLRVAVVLCSTFVLGTGVNQLLVRSRSFASQFDLGSGTMLRFRSFAEVIDGLKAVSIDAMNGVSNLDRFISVPVHAGQLVVYAIIWAWCFHIAWTLLTAMRLTVRSATRSLAPTPIAPPHPLLFLNVTAAACLLVGVMAAACFNSDSGRHFYFAIFCLKLLGIERAFRALCLLAGSRSIAGVALAVWVGIISSFTALYVGTGPHSDRVNLPSTSQTVAALREAMVRYNTRWVYGADFWKMSPLNSYVPNARSTELVNANGVPMVRNWLSRPSSACERGVVLYYLAENDGTDRMIAAAVAGAGGELVATVDGKQIWVGRAVWRVDRPC